MRVMRRLVSLLVPEWKWILVGTILSLATALANIALLSLSGWFIASMAVAGASGVFFSYGVAAAGVRALALARAGGRYAERLVNHDTSLRLLARLRVWFFHRLVPLAPAALTGHRSGDLLSRISSDVDLLDDFYVRGVLPCVVAILAAACLVPWLARYDHRLAALDLTAVAGAGLALPLIIQRLAREPGRRRVSLTAESRAGIVEQAQGMAELVALGALEGHARDLLVRADRLEREHGRLAGLQGLGDAGVVAGAGLAVWSAAVIGAPLVASGAIRPPDFALLTLAALASLEPVLAVPLAIQKAGELAAAARRLFRIADTPPAVLEPAVPAAGLAGGQAGAHLAIRGLRFRYTPDTPWVLDGLDLDAPPGARVGVYGPTGAGKSTLVGVLLRFWSYQGGSIRIEDRELDAMSGESARDCFRVAPQMPHLFHTTIRENLLLASGAATDTELRAVLRTAQLGDLDLDTVAGEGGRELSAGEARRLSIARALLRRAPIAILDEPTEGLDDVTAAALLGAVDRALAGVTLILISHRERDLAVTSRRVVVPGGGPS